MKKVLGNKKAILLYVAPAAILYSIFVILPVIWSVYYTFFSGMPGIKWKFCGFDNYLRIFKDSNFKKALIVNIKYILIVTGGQVCLGLGMSLIFKFWLKKFANLIRTIVFFPVVLPTVAVAQLFVKIYEIQPHYGLLNSLLHAVGLDALIQPWLGQASTALGSLSAMDIWTAVGFYAIIFYGALLDISGDVIEAARIDGCKATQLFRHVLAPLLRPMIITCLIFSFTGTVKMFESAMALTQGGPGGATKSLSIYMYDAAFTYSKTGYGSLIALIIFGICVVGSAIIRKFEKPID
ncbi:MAG: sugar ABC transporter permease [Blautia sp.]|nr:sugar ABC transporter permease [Blautia sp.]